MQPTGVVNLTARRPIRDKSEPFLPKFCRYKHYPIGREEEEAIAQAEVCLDALTDKMIESGDAEKAGLISSSFEVIRRMRLALAAMGATRTTMGYN